MKKIVLSLVIPILAYSYSNCDFKEKKYIPICKEMVKKGIDINYANKMLLMKKNKTIDKVTLRLFKPSKIKHHKMNEKKANNTLVKHIPTIVKHLNKYEEVYDKAETKYKVNREIIAAILTKETWLGKIKPKHDAWLVFNSLYLKLKPDSNRNKRLIRMGKNNMLHISKYCYKKNIEPEQCIFKSSYAGAVGIPQFMPMNFWLIEGYNKKVGDLTNMEDSIMSAAKFLNKNAKFRSLIDWNKFKEIKNIETDWYEYSFNNKSVSYFKPKKKIRDNIFVIDSSYKEFDYLNIYVKKILRYNNSINYSLGVLRIAYESSKGLRG